MVFSCLRYNILAKLFDWAKIISIAHLLTIRYATLSISFVHSVSLHHLAWGASQTWPTSLHQPVLDQCPLASTFPDLVMAMVRQCASPRSMAYLLVPSFLSVFLLIMLCLMMINGGLLLLWWLSYYKARSSIKLHCQHELSSLLFIHTKIIPLFFQIYKRVFFSDFAITLLISFLGVCFEINLGTFPSHSGFL